MGRLSLSADGQRNTGGEVGKLTVNGLESLATNGALESVCRWPAKHWRSLAPDGVLESGSRWPAKHWRKRVGRIGNRSEPGIGEPTGPGDKEVRAESDD